MIGQAPLLKAMSIAASAFKNASSMGKDHRPSSFFITGHPGMGKTHFSRAYAKFLGKTTIEVSGAAPMEKVDMFRVLVTANQSSAVLFIDEIHLVDKKCLEYLLPAIDESNPHLPFFNANDEPISIETPNLVLVAATTDPGKVENALVSRFQVRYHMEPYSQDEIAEMVATWGDTTDSEAMAEIAKRSKGVPRIARALNRTSLSVALSDMRKEYDARDLEAAFEVAGVSRSGMDRMDRAFLSQCGDHKFRPLSYLASQSGVDIAEATRIRDWLVSIGEIEAGPRGCRSTAKEQEAKA